MIGTQITQFLYRRKTPSQSTRIFMNLFAGKGLKVLGQKIRLKQLIVGGNDILNLRTILGFLQSAYRHIGTSAHTYALPAVVGKSAHWHILFSTHTSFPSLSAPDFTKPQAWW